MFINELWPVSQRSPKRRGSGAPDQVSRRGGGGTSWLRARCEGERRHTCHFLLPFLSFFSLFFFFSVSNLAPNDFLWSFLCRASLGRKKGFSESIRCVCL